jgi:hypothetical protein
MKILEEDAGEGEGLGRDNGWIRIMVVQDP